VTLLGEVAFWNNLGFDRSAAQIYFLAPVRFETVLLAKNIAGMIFVFLELFLITAIILLLRLPFGPAKFAEALLATMVFSLYLLAIGNFGSVRYPRTMDPSQSWRTSTGSGFHALLLLLYPLTFGPVLIAYGARHVFKSEAAFYLVVLLGLIAGFAFYRLGLHWASRIAEQRREQIVGILTAGAGPIS
jgi:ABC-2 type transport system permease protein